MRIWVIIGLIMSVGSSPPWERLRQSEEGTFDPGFWVSTTILAGVPAAPLRRSMTFLTATRARGRRRRRKMVLIIFIFGFINFSISGLIKI